MSPVSFFDPDFRKLDDWFTQIGLVKDAFSAIMTSIQSPDDYAQYDACFWVLEHRFAELVDVLYPSLPLISSE